MFSGVAGTVTFSGATAAGGTGILTSTSVVTGEDDSTAEEFGTVREFTASSDSLQPIHSEAMLIRTMDRAIPEATTH